MLQPEILIQLVAINTKPQFGGSPDLTVISLKNRGQPRSGETGIFFKPPKRARVGRFAGGRFEGPSATWVNALGPLTSGAFAVYRCTFGELSKIQTLEIHR